MWHTLLSIILCTAVFASPDTLAQTAAAEGSVEANAVTLPADDETQQLVEETLLRFDAAVKTADFGDFLASVSQRWRYRGKDPAVAEKQDPKNLDHRITKAALEKTFKVFTQHQVDLSPLKGKKMRLDAPASLNADGVLTLQGRYETEVTAGTGAQLTARKASFKLEFVREDTHWKLFGISVDLQ